MSKPNVRTGIGRTLGAAAGPLAALLVAFGFAAVVIAVSGENPFVSFAAMFAGALGSGSAVAETLVKAIPLAISGLAVALGLRAGLFNIGVEGQLLVGALCAGWIGFAVRLPAVIHLPLCMLAGIAGGAVWGFLPGLLKAKRGVHEVITTIMLNYIAFYLTHYLVMNPLKDRSTMAPQTPEIHSTASLGYVVESGGLHWGILIAAMCVIGFAFLINRTVAGYELKTVGRAPDAARAAGISVSRTIILAMILSGGLAGLAGSVEVLGVHHKFYDQFSPGYGFDSIAVALLGGNTALGTALAALLFGALRNGAVNMQLAANTPKEIVTLIQAIVIIFAGARFLRAPSTTLLRRGFGGQEHPAPPSFAEASEGKSTEHQAP